MTALRYNEGKPEYSVLLGYFKDSLEEVIRARKYGIEKYENGLTNWMMSMGEPEHSQFRNGCVNSAIRHLVEVMNGVDRDALQNNTHHLAFCVLNCLMAMEYDLSE